MINQFIKFILFFLIVFTPIAFGSMELWAFSLMELGILLVVILGTIQELKTPSQNLSGSDSNSPIRNLKLAIPLILLGLFLIFVLFQSVPLPAEIMKVISPKTLELHQSLSIPDSQLSFLNVTFPTSFVPFATQIEFLKWFSLISLFFFLLRWELSANGFRTTHQLITLIMIVGVAESLYGMIEFFSGHRYILTLNQSSLVSSVTGTFTNRNYFAGYLLMVIPFTVGFLFSRQVHRSGTDMGWRRRLSVLDGKSLLIGYSVIIMILGLLFSASRMGITSLLLSFSIIIILFRDPGGGEKFSKTSVLIVCLAIAWAAWIGLDAVIGRFFAASENFKSRWTIWADTFRILKDFPLFGAGLGTFQQIFPMYQSVHVEGFFSHAENDFLQLASEIGLVGIGLLSIVFFYLFLKAVFLIRSLSRRNPKRYVGIGGLVGTLALIFHSTVERNIQVPANAFLFTVVLAMVLRFCTATRRGDE